LDPVTMREVAIRFLPLAGLHHLAIFVIAVTVWNRRESAHRLLGFYLSTAFATSSVVLLTHTGTRPAGMVAVVLCALWLRYTLGSGRGFSFRLTPRPRLALMGLAVAFAVGYPGFSPDLPSFIFSPLGVTLRPTVLASLAVLNAVERRVDRTLHWALTVAGALLGVVGMARGFWPDAALVLTSGYAVFLLLRGGGVLSDVDDAPAGNVEEMRRRMYSRRSFLLKPRDPRRRQPGRRTGRR
jgi:hypothetical protein